MAMQKSVQKLYYFAHGFPFYNCRIVDFISEKVIFILICSVKYDELFGSKIFFVTFTKLN